MLLLLRRLPRQCAIADLCQCSENSAGFQRVFFPLHDQLVVPELGLCELDARQVHQMMFYQPAAGCAMDVRNKQLCFAGGIAGVAYKQCCVVGNIKIGKICNRAVLCNAGRLLWLVIALEIVLVQAKMVDSFCNAFTSGATKKTWLAGNVTTKKFGVVCRQWLTAVEAAFPMCVWELATQRASSCAGCFSGVAAGCMSSSCSLIVRPCL